MIGNIDILIKNSANFRRKWDEERRGSGMKKIINTYRRYEHLSDYHAPKFTSNASEFHVTLWNLNYDGSDNITTRDRASQEMEFIKEPKEFTKEFIKEPIEVGEKWENGKLSMKNTRDSLIEYPSSG